MEKIIEFIKSLFSPKALLGVIVGIAIGFFATRIINITPDYQIHYGEFIGAILVSMYFWLYCLQVEVKLATPVKFTITFLIIVLLSFGGLGIVRQPILYAVAVGEENQNQSPFDILSYMIAYGIICVFIGGLIETIGDI